MTFNINYKKLPAFTCDIEAFSAALTRIVDVTKNNNGTEPTFILTVDDDKLYMIGIAPEVVSYLSIEVNAEQNGICHMPAIDMLGVLKKRKGPFSIRAANGEIKISNKNLEAKKKGIGFEADLTLKEMLPETPDKINQIDHTVNGTKLSSKMMAELKTAVKCASLKSVSSGDPLPVLIRVEDTFLKTAGYDEYHAVVYEGKTEHKKAKDFDMCISGSSYIIIDKFIGNQSVIMERSDNTLKLLGTGGSYASIPPSQSEGEFEIFSRMSSNAKVKAELTFSIGSEIFESLVTMYALKHTSYDGNEPFFLEKVKAGIKATYITTSGKVSETFVCKDLKGDGKFEMSDKVLMSLAGVFSKVGKVVFELGNGRFAITHDCDAFHLVGAGSLNEPD